jgi:hypothetical protein
MSIRNHRDFDKLRAMASLCVRRLLLPLFQPDVPGNPTLCPFTSPWLRANRRGSRGDVELLHFHLNRNKSVSDAPWMERPLSRIRGRK